MARYKTLKNTRICIIRTSTTFLLGSKPNLYISIYLRFQVSYFKREHKFAV